MPLYIVSDLVKPWASHVARSHWRTMGVFNNRAAAKAWAGPESIITEHEADEAWAIHATRVLPDAALSHQIAA